MSDRFTLRRRRLAAGLMTLAAAAALVLPATVAVAAPHGPAMTSQTPLPVRNGSARDMGAYSPSATIRLAIGLKPPHRAAEQQFLREIQTKSSPLFHHYLTPAAWTARFGPSAAAQQAVVSWARAAGLTVTHLYPNRLIVDLAGHVGTIEKALGVQINNYRLGAKTFFANDRDPVLPQALRSTVESVEGLSSLQTMFPASPGLHEPASPAYVPGPVVQAGPHAAANGSRAKLRAAERASARHMTQRTGRRASGGPKLHITGGAYDPTDIYSSQGYDYNALYAQGHCCNPLGNPSNSPAQTSIAIATFGSQQVSDMAGFQAQYPYLAYNIQEVFIDGTPACCDARGDDGHGVVDGHVQQLRWLPEHLQGVPLRRRQLQRLHLHRHVQQDGHRQRGPGVQHELELHRAVRLQHERDEHQGRDLQRDGRPGLDPGRRVRGPGCVR